MYWCFSFFFPLLFIAYCFNLGQSLCHSLFIVKCPFVFRLLMMLITAIHFFYHNGIIPNRILFPAVYQHIISSFPVTFIWNKAPLILCYYIFICCRFVTSLLFYLLLKSGFYPIQNKTPKQLLPYSLFKSFVILSLCSASLDIPAFF